METPENDIASVNGVDVIINRLNRLYKKDSTVTKYQALEAFETFRGPSNMSMQSFLNEFKKKNLQNQVILY